MNDDAWKSTDFTDWHRIATEAYITRYRLKDTSQSLLVLVCRTQRHGDPGMCSCEYLDICYNRMETRSVDKANVLREVLMIRDGLLEFSNDPFKFYELDDLVKLLAS